MTELRTEKSDDGRSVIQGHAAVFDSWSETLGGLFPFKEKVRAGAFQKSIESDDIRALWNHEPRYVLGRNKSGTLDLAEDGKGLYVRIYPPETQWAKDLTESIRRGDVSQMSIGFTVEKEKWSSGDGIDTRELTEVKLFDVSPVTFPAYTETDVGVRAYEAYRAETRAKSEAEKLTAQTEKRAADAAKLQHYKNKLKIIGG
jgi:HK97 family phage prohead protease